MLAQTKAKAEQIYSNDDLILVSSSPYGFHWMVRQSNGAYCDVWYRKRDGNESWECNSVTNRRSTGSEKWGCVMNKSKQGESKPWCSHTLACYNWLKNFNKAKPTNFFSDKVIHEKEYQI